MHLATLLVAALVASGSSWIDPAGDAPGGPDVTSVSAVAANGALTLTVRTAAAAPWADAVAFLPLDVAPGGDPDGYDVELTLHSLHDQATIERWSGGSWKPTDEAPTFSLTGATLTMSVPLATLGSPAAVRLAVRTRGPAGGDDAGPWTLATRAVVVFAPTHPTHARSFAVRGASECVARLAGRRLVGGCRWTIPGGSRGKQLVVTANGRTYRFRVR